MNIDTQASFASFGLSQGVLDALTRKGFTGPTSIQSIALPRLLADEGHLIVKARTGTGKTAAFGIPLAERLTSGGQLPRALILSPTRELALQVSREIASIVPGPFPRVTAVYGGASMRNQIMDLKRGTEIVAGTPGRIMDLMERKVLDLSLVEWLILDEADEMLDMGFFEDVEKIIQAVKNYRRLALFSATMPEAILRLVREHFGAVEIVEDTAPEDEKPAVDQFYMVLRREDRLEALRRVIDAADDFYGLIFCATKAGADELARRLAENSYAAEAIHGDLSQEARERTLRRFRARPAGGGSSILVATDVAARGLDIERLTHVINWDLPNDRETYVHRIGRTGRAGRRGMAVSFALPSERGKVAHLSRAMERALGNRILWMKVPAVKAVMKSQRERIALSIIAALSPPLPIPAEDPAVIPAVLPGDEPAVAPEVALSPLSKRLIGALGAEGAVEALVTRVYGEFLDPARYGPVTEFEEAPKGEGERKPGKRVLQAHGLGRDARVYVGLGRRHGASARDVAGLLMRAGSIPGRMVDAIEIKEYCAFATLPAEAATRACAFSRNSPGEPLIKPASAPRH